MLELRVGHRSQIFLCTGILPEEVGMKVKTVQEIESALSSVAKDIGVEIYEVVFKQGRNPSLTIFLDTDREGGIDLDTCEKFHNAANPVLDELDPTFGQPYTLNVSSPGLDRPFKKEKDYLRNIGKRVEIKLYAPYKGEKFFEAVLLEYNPVAGNVTLEKGEERFKLNLNQIVKMSQAIDFD